MNATLRIDTGATAPAAGTLRVYDPGKQSLKAAGFALGGLALAGVLIFVPLLHLITTWLVPLLGFFLAWTTWRTDRTLTAIEGPCPGCKAPIRLDGGRVEDPMWDQCPACKRPVQIILSKEA